MKLHFCKKQAMNRSASMIFRLVRLIILLYNRQKKDIKRGKFIGRPRTKFIAIIYMLIKYSFVQKQVVKYWCDF